MMQTQHTALHPRRWLVFLLDLLYPIRCGGCAEAGKGVWCESCNDSVQRLFPPLQTCQLPLAASGNSTTMDVTSAARYLAPLRDGIHTFKYDGTPDLAAPFGQLMADCWIRSKLQADCLVPVPLHPRRRRERGYNQSELLSSNLGQIVGVPVEARLLRRVRYTDQQALLTHDERRGNVRGAFAAEVGCVAGKRVVLVDDVFTTGATLCECAVTLLNAGAQSVGAMTLARAG
ncbi:MAG TPA: ComF family protein [Anaerolineae bacterium]|jgi:ComF family protein